MAPAAVQVELNVDKKINMRLFIYYTGKKPTYYEQAKIKVFTLNMCTYGVKHFLFFVGAVYEQKNEK